MESNTVSTQATGGLPVMPASSTTCLLGGTRDGIGAADHDMPYKFGRRPRASAPYPFSTRQYVRLLVLRSRIGADLFGRDDLSAA
jgi:hypothetical protein